MRVLQVTTYSLDTPRHGGQIRCTKVKERIESDGHVVDTVCVIQPHENSKKNKFVKVFGDGLPRLSGLGPNFPDVALDRIFDLEQWATSLAKSISNDLYDVVLVEQPWMFRPVYKHFTKSGKRPAFVYSGHNNEVELKTSIALTLGISTRLNVEFVAKEAKRIETFAIKHSDLVIAVTAVDADYYSSLGAKRILLAQNAVERMPARTPKTPSAEILKYFLFVGSAHIPNLKGFQEMLGSSLAFLPPDFKVVCAGSVCDLIHAWMQKEELGGAYQSRIHLAGQVSDEELKELIERCRAILLPITSGSGSNLKTAEAIASGKPVVATGIAMRGFEPWIYEPGIHVADSHVEFVAQISRLLTSDVAGKVITRKSSPSNPLYWDDALADLDLMSSLGRKK